MDDSNSNSKYKFSFYEMSDIVERFVYRNVENTELDFGSGLKFNTIEIHILTGIANHPGITVTRLAEVWGRTKGAISQIVKKLEAKGFVYKEPDPKDRKAAHLFVSEEGMVHVRAHMSYDEESSRHTIETLGERFSKKDIESFFEILSVYNNISFRSAPDEQSKERMEFLKAEARKAMDLVLGREK